MKKLLILLTLGLMFGQTKLETRLFTDIPFENGAGFDFGGIVEGFDYVNVEIVDVNFEFSNSYGGSYCNFEIYQTMTNYNGIVSEIRLFENGSFVFFNFGGNSFTIVPGHSFGMVFPVECHETTGTFDIFVTAEFPIEDTGYMEEDFDFCINEGLNLVSYPCENDIAINDALPSEISNNLSSIVGEGVAGINVNGTWVGSLTQLQAGSGYWFKSSIEACFNYDCEEN